MPTKPDQHTAGLVMDLDALAVHYALGGNALGRLLGLGGGIVKAVDGVTVSLHRGEVLGLVGESGSGKTTLGRALLGLAPATGGELRYHDPETGVRDVAAMGRRELRELRTDVQMVFQDPHAALNPTMTIEQAVGHPLVVHQLAKGAELRRRVVDVLERVGLSPAAQFLDKLPSDLSGGQKQRAVIARAIIVEPDVLVADEPVSMLDMSVRAKILQLMLDLKNDLGLTYVYITHDLATAKFFCDRVAIMYLGRIVELGPTAEIFANPRHPYTQALVRAIPDPDPDRMVPRDLPRGEIADAAKPPLGCHFHPRCPKATDICGWESRDLRVVLEQHWTRVPPETYERDRALIGSLDNLDDPSLTATLGTGANAPEVRALLDRIKAENPDEPLWHGVEAIEETASGLEVRFHGHVDPPLRPDGDVDVACVLYTAPDGTQPTR